MYVQVPATTAVPLSLHAEHIDPDPGIIRPTMDLSSLKGTNTCPRSTQSKPSELVLKRARIPTQREGADGTVERFHGHCLRISGSQALIRMGFNTTLLTLLGQWGSQAILRILEEHSRQPTPGTDRRRRRE